MFIFAAKIASETDSSDKTEDGAEIDEVQQSWWHRKRWETLSNTADENLRISFIYLFFLFYLFIYLFVQDGDDYPQHTIFDLITAPCT